MMSENVFKFVSNYYKQHPVDKSNPVHTSNIYHIVAKDLDGNITQEYYGKNIFTEKGLETIGGFNNNQKWRLAIGCGGGGYFFNREDNHLYDPVKHGLSTNQSFCKNTSGNLSTQPFPIHYDPDTGLSIQYIPFSDNDVGYIFDYNIMDETGEDYYRDPIYINEIGLVNKNAGAEVSSEDNDAYTHSKVYDIDGNPTIITKNPYEQLTIHVYLVVSVNTAVLLDDLDSSGIPAVVSPTLFIRLVLGIDDDPLSFLFLRKDQWRNSMAITGVAGFRGYASSDAHCTTEYDVESGGKYSISAVDRQTFIENGNFVSRIMVTNQAYYNNRILGWNADRSFIGFISEAAGFSLQSAESFEQTIMSNLNDNTFDDVTCSYFGTSTSQQDFIADSCGYCGRLPMTRYSFNTMKVYDYSQHAWVNENFDADPYIDYEHTMYPQVCVYYKIEYNDPVYERYIFVNDRTAFPIIRFDTSLLVWASDTYWDPSTWEPVAIANVQASLSKKKYYITTDRTGINPVWDTSGDVGTMLTLRLDNVVPEFTLPNNGINIAPATTTVNNLVLCNHGRNCLVTPNYIIYLDSTDPSDASGIVRYTITNYGNNTVESYKSTNINYTSSNTLAMFRLTENGDKLVMSMFNAPNVGENFRGGAYRIWTISNDKTVAPTSTDISLGFTTTARDTNTIHSFSDKGYVVCTHNNDMEIKVLNVNTATVSSITGRWGYALNRTTNVAYEVTDNVEVTTIAVHNVATDTEVCRIEFDKLYTVNCIFGWKNNLYVRLYDTSYLSYSVYYYDINEDSLVDITANTSDIFGTNANNYFTSVWLQCGWDHSASSCDEAMLIPSGTAYTNVTNDIVGALKCHIVLATDPTNFRTITPATYQAYGKDSSMQYKDYTTESRTGGHFMRTLDGKFLGLDIYTYSSASTDPKIYVPNRQNWTAKLLDIGYLYDTDTSDDIYGTNNPFPVTSTDGYKSLPGTGFVLYKDWVVQYYDASNIIFRPLSRYRIHKIDAATTTIQSFNNPKDFVPTNELQLSLGN